MNTLRSLVQKGQSHASDRDFEADNVCPTMPLWVLAIALRGVTIELCGMTIELRWAAMALR